MQAKWVENPYFMEPLGEVVFIKGKYKSNLIERVALKANCFRIVTTLRHIDLLAESKYYLSMSTSM